MIDRKQTIKNLLDKGWTYQQIGDFLGLSRQRIHQVYTGYHSPANNPKPTKCIPIEWIPAELNGSDGRLSGRDYLSEIVRRRDNHTCQICGKIWKKGERKLDVHHIDEENENNPSYANYKKFDRMITLCHKCHLNLGTIRKKMSLSYKGRQIKK